MRPSTPTPSSCTSPAITLTGPAGKEIAREWLSCGSQVVARHSLKLSPGRIGTSPAVTSIAVSITTSSTELYPAGGVYAKDASAKVAVMLDPETEKSHAGYEGLLMYADTLIPPIKVAGSAVPSLFQLPPLTANQTSCAPG